MSLKRTLKRIGKGLRKIVKSKFGKLLIAGGLMYMAPGLLGGKAAAGAGEATGASATAAGETLASGAMAPAATSTSVAGKGFLNRAISGIGGFVEKNPMASSMIFNAAASALSPDETELMEEQERIRQQRWQNIQVPRGIGISPGRGVINRGIN